MFGWFPWNNWFPIGQILCPPVYGLICICPELPKEYMVLICFCNCLLCSILSILALNLSVSRHLIFSLNVVGEETDL